MLEIPAGTPLGVDEHDFSYVLTRSYDRMKGCWMDPVPPIAFFSTGKLGALKGGLLNLQDAREVLNKDAIWFPLERGGIFCPFIVHRTF